MHDISSTYRNAVPNRRHADVRRCGSKLVRYWLRSHWSLSSVGDGEGGAESREFGAGWVGVGSWSGSPGRTSCRPAPCSPRHGAGPGRSARHTPARSTPPIRRCRTAAFGKGHPTRTGSSARWDRRRRSEGSSGGRRANRTDSVHRRRRQEQRAPLRPSRREPSS